MHRKLSLILFVAVLISCFTVNVVAQNQAERFKRANAFYQDKDYVSARSLYEAILKDGYESAALYYNLGNTAYKSGDLGYAVLYYYRGTRLDPTDLDLRNNLEFVSSLSQVQMEGVELNPVRSFFEDIVGSYSLSSLAWLTSAFFILFILVLIARIGFSLNNSAIRVSTVFALLLCLVVAGLTTFKYQTDYLRRRAVIVADECSVLSGPSEKADVEFDGAPGLLVEIIETNGDYVNVLFANKRTGWLKKEIVAVI